MRRLGVILVVAGLVAGCRTVSSVPRVRWAGGLDGWWKNRTKCVEASQPCEPKACETPLRTKRKNTSASTDCYGEARPERRVWQGRSRSAQAVCDKCGQPIPAEEAASVAAAPGTPGLCVEPEQKRVVPQPERRRRRQRPQRRRPRRPEPPSFPRQPADTADSSPLWSTGSQPSRLTSQTEAARQSAFGHSVSPVYLPAVDSGWAVTAARTAFTLSAATFPQAQAGTSGSETVRPLPTPPGQVVEPPLWPYSPVARAARSPW